MSPQGIDDAIELLRSATTQRYATASCPTSRAPTASGVKHLLILLRRAAHAVVSPLSRARRLMRNSKLSKEEFDIAMQGHHLLSVSPQSRP